MTRTTRGERITLAAIVVVAAALRIAWSLYAARPPSPELHDPNFYRFFGEQLANGKGYRLPDGEATAYYPVGYSLSLAAAFWVVYRTPLPDDIETGVIAALNIGWQVLAVVLAFAIVRRLTSSTRAGLVAAAVLALWPNLVFHSAVALTESLFIALFLAATYLAVAGPWAERRFAPARLLAIGALLGAATLVRPITPPAFAALAIAFLAASFGWKRALAHTGVVAAAALVVVTPWVVRNAIVMDQVTLSTNTGDNLCMSRRVGGSGTFELPNERCFNGPWDWLPRPQLEVARDAHGRREAIDFVRDHPGEEVSLIRKRAMHTFKDDTDGLDAAESYGTDPFIDRDLRDILARTANAYALVAASLAIPGIAMLAMGTPRAPRLVVLVSGIGLLIPPLVFFGDPRFHVPAIPFAAIAIGALAGLGPGRPELRSAVRPGDP